MSVTASRLERMRQAVGQHALARPAPRPQERSLPPLERILGGEWKETPLGPVFLRDEWYPLDHHHGALPLSAPLAACPHGMAALGNGAAPEAGRLCFFDIETTGLSGGTGTYIVLAGLGSFEAHGFRMRQYFLADIGAERAMLGLLAADFARFDGVVTYNGRAFDLPIVEGRMAMARLPFDRERLAHIDLLHVVRRLYKHRMPGCRLAEAERRLLRIERPDDVPGWLIPSLYMDYVRAGRAAPLRGVFRHNAEDVLSLAGVLAQCARILSPAADLDPDDAVAAARWWEHAGDEPRAVTLYAYALPWLEGGNDWVWAASRYARLCRRHARRPEAAALWARLWAAGDPSAGLALAKHLEHTVRDIAGAERIAAELAGMPELPFAAHLPHRLARLRRKLAARQEGGSDGHMG